MTDYCTKNATEADFNTVMLGCGLCVDNGGEVVPASYLVCLDRIGPITLSDGTYYPEYYANLRLLEEPTPEQEAALSAISIDPAQPQYRVWA